MIESVRASSSLRTQLSLALLGLVLLATVSTVGVILVSQSARDDAAAINLAGSLRMQAYRIALISHTGSSEADLESAVRRFGETLNRPELRRAIERHDRLSTHLDFGLVRAWHQRLNYMFKPAIPAVAGQQRLKSLLPIDALVDEIDAMVGQLQLQAERRLRLLRLMQAVTLVLMLGLALGVIRRLRGDFAEPLARLMKAINRISRGDLTARVFDYPQNEIGLISHHCNEMAGRLAVLQDNLEAEVDAKTVALRRKNQALARESEQKQRNVLIQERQIIARELHDSVAQSLSYLKIQILRLRQQLNRPENGAEALSTTIDDLDDGVAHAQRDLRQLLMTFRLQVEQPDLPTALQAVIDEFSARFSAVSIRFECDPDLPDLNADLKVHLVHTLREALSNVFRHAQASRVDVTVHLLPGGKSLRLWVEDDGIGFDQQVESGAAPHFGLDIMRERAWQMGGQCHVHPGTPQGTRVEVEVPLS